MYLYFCLSFILPFPILLYYHLFISILFTSYLCLSFFIYFVLPVLFWTFLFLLSRLNFYCLCILSLIACTCLVYLMCSTCASFCHFPLVFLSLCLFFSCCRFAVLRMFHICFCGLFCCVLDYFWISCFILFFFIYFSSSWSMDLFIPCTACFIILVSYSH